MLGDQWLLSTQLSSGLVVMLADFIWLRLNGSFNYSIILATCSHSGFQVSGELCVVCAQASWSLARPSQASGIHFLDHLNSFLVVFFTLRSCFEICNETAFSSYCPSSSFTVTSVFRLDNQHSGYCLGASFWPCKYPAHVNVARATVLGAITSVCTCSEIALVHQIRLATDSTIFSVWQACIQGFARCREHAHPHTCTDCLQAPDTLKKSEPLEVLSLWCLSNCLQSQVAAGFP